MSTLPVRSPLPNSVPSTRSAPAISASSAAATAVPRSLCGMDREDDARTVGNAPPEPFELVGVGVGRRHFDGRRQVEDEPPRRGRLDDVLDRLADVEREVELGAGEALGRILELKVRSPAASASALTCLAALTAISVTPLRSVLNTTSRCKRRGRVIEVDDDLPRALDRRERALDQFRPALGQAPGSRRRRERRRSR